MSFKADYSADTRLIGVIEVVELKSSSWYNTGKEVIKAAQTRAHFVAAERYSKKVYDRILLKLRKGADINGDAIATTLKHRKPHRVFVESVTETVRHDNAKTTDKGE